MQRVVYGLFGMLLLGWAIYHLTAPSLDGTWTSTMIINDSTDTLAIDSGNVQLILRDGQYSFQSTLAYTEKGQVNITRKSIELTPESTDIQPYKVHILDRTTSTLVLKMFDSSKSQLVHFYRTN